MSSKKDIQFTAFEPPYQLSSQLKHQITPSRLWEPEFFDLSNPELSPLPLQGLRDDKYISAGVAEPDAYSAVPIYSPSNRLTRSID